MGKVICIGLGPGDPDLMSLRAHRHLQAARQVAYFRKPGRKGQARQIVDGMLHPEVTEYPMEYPVTTEIPFDHPDYKALLAGFYDDWATRLSDLAQRDDVIVLCEGDPFFYGSFMHLHSRLRGRAETTVVPGITGMSGCWSATDIPITWGDDVLSVITATMPEDEITRRAADTDALVVMKIGRNLDKLRRALDRAGRLDDTWIVERGTMPGQKIRKLNAVDDTVPYFAIALIHGNGRRP